jgi:hypothetical protein
MVSLPSEIGQAIRAAPYCVGLSFSEVMRSYALSRKARLRLPLFTALTSERKALSEALSLFA